LALETTVARGWEVHQMDMKNAFLHGYLLEDIYMEQPHGFIYNLSLIFLMKNSLYVLKKALRA
jgi:hypothetical protein